MERLVSNKNAVQVKVKEGKNSQKLYEHQLEALKKLNEIDLEETFRSLLVLPTGAGKTKTSVHWLLKNVLDKKKNILWVAHRQLLLEQAAEAFEKNCFSDVMVSENEFSYRLISGVHDKVIHIEENDDVIIASKDSLISNLEELKKWLKGKEVYLVIDEAHHATAKSYRKIIECVENNSLKMKLLGLTATPIRTSEQEKGLLGKVFTDGIAYEIDLKSLIKKKILSTPIPEIQDTEIDFGETLSLKAQKSIDAFDMLPDDIAEEIAKNKERNNIIVKKYFEDYKKYGQTIVFAINKIHALALKSLFEEYGKNYGIKAGVIVSGTQTAFIGIEVSNKENARQIEAYKNGEIQVLINVNILTEGTDLPKTKTVFLTRPTTSRILMTQMVGRALRGEAAGGTTEAHIVSFRDDWSDKVIWENPEILLNSGEFKESRESKRENNFRLLSIHKIEEFARLMDNSVDNTFFQSVSFIKKIPVGMYNFSFIDINGIERNHQILIYDSTRKAYQNLINDLPKLFKKFNIEDEVIPKEILLEIISIVEEKYFSDDMIPPYSKKDIEYLLCFFAINSCEPEFVSIDELDRKKIDISLMAQETLNKRMTRMEENEFLNKLWEENTLLKIYFNQKKYFKDQFDTEIDKILNPDSYITNKTNKILKMRPIEELSLHEIEKINPNYASELKNEVFLKAKNEEKNYCCAKCGKESKSKAVFQIDHIKPMSKGGLSISKNLQLLCRTCNLQKGNKYEV